MSYLEDLFSVAGKVALVTGAATGIGRMAATALVMGGARVFIASRKGADCARVAEEINALGGPGEAEGFAGDVGTEQGIAALVAQVKSRTDRLDILINNAGVTWGAEFAEFPYSAWEKVFSVNVAGLFHLTRELTPLLEEAASEDDPARSLAHWLTPDGDLPEGAGPTTADQVAFFQLSGGSTGTPKLIPRTHNDYDYSIRASVQISGVTSATRFLCALPAGHNFTMSSPGTLGVFHAGGTVVMAPSPEPLGCFQIVARERITMAPLVPPAVALWLRAVEEDPARRAMLDSLELMLVGGASFAEATARRVPELLGCRLQQVFGMAEGLVNYTRLDDPPEVVFTTQGRPISPDDEVRIVDEDGNDVPDGTPGALATRGPYTFRGYYRSPEHNAKAFDAEGFYYSGDVVVRQGGNLRVVGRIKDQINRGGEKIAAEEIENLLVRHPDITHAALVAAPDAHLGEKSCAFLVLREGAGKLSPPALRRHLLELGVAEYKLPDRFRFVPELPLTAVGKIDKRRLRDSLVAETAA